MGRQLNLKLLRTTLVSQGNIAIGKTVLAPLPEDVLAIDSDTIKSSELLGFNEYERPTAFTLHCKGVYFFERITLYTGETYDIYRTV